MKTVNDLVIDVGDVTIRSMSYGPLDAPLARCLHRVLDTCSHVSLFGGASTYEVLPGVGRFLHLEHPDAVRRAIDALLDD